MKKRSINICSTYLLPLLDLNRFSFGKRENFVDSYLNYDDHHLIVEVKTFSEDFSNNLNYRFHFERDNHVYLVYSIPEIYDDTVVKFKTGKFSLFQEEVKDKIKKKAGLMWRVPKGRTVVSCAVELLALDKDKDLKTVMEKKLSVTIADDAELMDIPNEENYKEFEIRK